MVGALAAVALAGATLIPSAPAGAATGGVTLVDSGTTFTGVVTVGSNVWAYAQGGCGANPNESYLDEFNPYGQMIRSIDLGAAALACLSTEPITTDGSVVAVLNGDGVTVVDGSSGATLNSISFSDPVLNFAYPPNPFSPEGALAVSGTTLVVVDWEGHAFAVDITSGAPLWQVPPACNPFFGATVDQGVLGLLCFPGMISAYNMTDGTPALPGNVSTPALGYGASMVASGAYAYFTTGLSDTIGRLSVPGYSFSGVASVPGGADLSAITVVGANLWVGSTSVNAIWPVGVVSGAPGTAVTLPTPAVSIAGEGGVVWAALQGGGLAEVGQPVPLFLASSLTLSAPSGASPVVGSPTTLTATVSTPGTVTFYDGSTAIPGCSGLSATTTVTCAWSPTIVGARSLSATLTPTDPSYLHSTSPTLTLTVAPEPTTVTAAFPSAPVASGPVSLPATGSVAGTLSFSVGGSFLPGCVGLAAPSGSATCHASLGVGSHPVTVALAPYGANDAPSNVTQVVKVVSRLLSGSVPFARGSSALDPAGRAALARLVAAIAAGGYTQVHLVGLGDGPGTGALARARAVTVAVILRHELSGVRIVVGAQPNPGSRVVVVASL